MKSSRAPKKHRIIVETDAEAFRDPDTLLIALEAALDAERCHGETTAVWLEGEVGSSVSSVATEMIAIDEESPAASS